MDHLRETVRHLATLASSYRPGIIYEAVQVVDTYLTAFQGYRARRAPQTPCWPNSPAQITAPSIVAVCSSRWRSTFNDGTRKWPGFSGRPTSPTYRRRTSLGSPLPGKRSLRRSPARSAPAASGTRSCTSLARTQASDCAGRTPTSGDPSCSYLKTRSGRPGPIGRLLGDVQWMAKRPLDYGTRSLRKSTVSLAV